MKKVFVGLAGAALIATQVAAQDAGEPKTGGNLIIGQQASPDFLDAMVSTAQGSRNVNLHIYEMLISRDEIGRPVPELAESFTESEDGLTYVFKLREGVTFHNDKPMTAEDVKASLERYAEVGIDRAFMEDVASIEVTDPLTVTVTLKSRVPSFIEQISSPRVPLVIIPAEDRENPRGQTSNIGTGPFKLDEWVPDSHVRLSRYDDYLPHEEKEGTDGFSGEKIAYVDTVTFRIIPETGARMSALEVGEIHINEDIPNQVAARLSNSETLDVVEVMPWGMLAAMFNVSNAPTNNPEVRRAIQIGVNAEEIIGIATDGVYRLGHGWNYPESEYWAGDVGLDRYNQGNVEKAREILAASGYNNELLIILSNSQIRDVNMASQVLTEQLRNIGFNVRLDSFDFPTMIARRKDPAAWNVSANFFGLAPWIGPYGLPTFFTGEENLILHDDPNLAEAAVALRSSPAIEDRVAAATEIQRIMYDEAYWLKFGDTGLKQGVHSSVKGFTPYRIPRAWNVWLDN